MYPAIGDDPMTGHAIFASGVDLWRTDIERFLARWVAGSPIEISRGVDSGD